MDPTGQQSHWKISECPSCLAYIVVPTHTAVYPTSHGFFCVILQNFVAIGRTVAEIWRFIDFFGTVCLSISAISQMFPQIELINLADSSK